MAATNFTPISLYYSTTAAAVPTSGNLVAGELALNTYDEKLYFKNSAGTVKLLASNAASTATVSSVAMSVPAFLSVAGSPITTSGTLAVTLSGTALPVANGGTGVTTSTGTGSVVLNTAPTLSGVTLNDGYTEEVYAVVDAAGVAISPTNGSIQTWTLGASRTPTAGTWAAGQSITLMINDGTAYTVTWTTLAVTWVGGTAPTLATTGFTVIQLWKVGSTIYGALTGSVA